MERVSTLEFEHIRRYLLRSVPFLFCLGFYLCVFSLWFSGRVAVLGYAAERASDAAVADTATIEVSEESAVVEESEGSAATENARVLETMEVTSEGTTVARSTRISLDADLARLVAVRPEFELLGPRVPSLIAALNELPWPDTAVVEKNADVDSVVNASENGSDEDTAAAWTGTAFQLLSHYLQNSDATTLASLREWSESQWEDESLSPEQRRFLSALRRRFPIWDGVVAESAECRRLAQLIERMEWNLPEQSEQEFLATIAAMPRSEVPATRERGERLSQTWCAPNFRTTVSLELFRHLIPPRRKGASSERYGQDPEIQIVLIPDEKRAYLRLETTGSLLSLPESTSPGQFRLTTSDAEFHAWKDIQVTGGGVELLPTQAEILERPVFAIPDEFQGFVPGFHGSPDVFLTHDLFGNPSPLAYLQITRDLRRAIQRDREATLNQAKQYLDREGEQRVGAIRQRIEDRLLNPLQEMKLGPMVRSASTTKDRAFFSLGIRTQDQCGGYTPTIPERTSDALLAIQIHESAFNNLVHQMGLSGATASLLEIQNRVAAQFNSPELLMADPSDGRFIITFPEQDALRIQTRSDQTIQVTLRATEFTDQYEETTWNDLEVRAIYRIVMTPEELRLERTEPIQLRGTELSGESQLRLRAIFGRILGREGYSAIRPGDIFSIEALQSLRFLTTQIHDGWIQLELGQARRETEEDGKKGNNGEKTKNRKMRKMDVWGRSVFW